MAGTMPNFKTAKEINTEVHSRLHVCAPDPSCDCNPEVVRPSSVQSSDCAEIDSDYETDDYLDQSDGDNSEAPDSQSDYSRD